MILYHLDKWRYRKIWPPEGSIHAEGRWNKAGQWIIYASPSISLAKLETLANTNNLPLRGVCMIMEVKHKSTVFEIQSSDLPDNWMQKPPPLILKIIMAEFLKSDCILMKVPSAQSYTESNFLINVRHPRFNKLVKLVSVAEEPFDPRLFT